METSKKETLALKFQLPDINGNSGLLSTTERSVFHSSQEVAEDVL
jgi:hypothetical protein